MLLELGQAITFLASLLSLYPAMFSAFFVPGARWEEQLLQALDHVALSGCLCFLSGVLFAWPLSPAGQRRGSILSTLPVKLFFCALAGMVLLFAASWWLEVYYVPLLWRNNLCCRWAGPSKIIRMDSSKFAPLEQSIEDAFQQGTPPGGDATALTAFQQLRDALEEGALRAAEPDPDSPTGWKVNAWVKRGILLGFRLGELRELNVVAAGGGLSFVDKHTFPARSFTPRDGVRVVPGGSSVRAGAYVSRGVVIMPPAYLNVGAYVDEGTMVDSHALVGSCAQIGKRVHLSAAVQIGGVLEPVNASPVIIEDDVLVGGNTGVYEGTIVRSRAVLAAGTVLTRGTPVYDVVNGVILKATAEMPLIIPSGAVVVPGSRAMTQGKGKEWGLSLATPVIVKYRDEKTELSLVLEELLR
jgi:2,3,4,5-tetrahydropyridine-2-carboxylate N-succinyltransferase